MTAHRSYPISKPPGTPEPASTWPPVAKYAIVAILGAALGSALMLPATGTPASCLQALTASEQQYDKLAEVLPAAAEAVEAAAYRSVKRLDASTTTIKQIKQDLDRQQPALDEAKEQCRG